MTTYSKYNSGSLYYRLIALWVVCEAMLGGIIHGLKLPVSGLIVGSCAVVCISLIAWYVPGRNAILKATIIVAIFKMMLSPQAPLPAYIAVFFQGLTGQLVFHNRKHFKLSCILFAVLALLESGLQRILVLTLVYGKEFWTVVNEFMNGPTRQKQGYNYSLLIGAVYTGIHFITGLVVGNWVSSVPARVSKWRELITGLPIGDFPDKNIPARKKRFVKKAWIIIWILLIILYIQSYYQIGKPLLPSSLPLKVLVRSFIILIAWIFIAGPLLKMLLHQWLQKKQTAVKDDISHVLELLPSMRIALTSAWKNSAVKKGLRRLILFGKLSLVNTLSQANKVYIFSGGIGTGKTTALLNWASSRNDVHGFLTPVIEGKRKFYIIDTKETFDMEAVESEVDVIKVGRFVFSKNAFQRAIEVSREAINKNGWLIIDEIGPLELRGEGFHDLLADVLKQRHGKTMIVAREGLAEKVAAAFRLTDYEIISSPIHLP